MKPEEKARLANFVQKSEKHVFASQKEHGVSRAKRFWLKTKNFLNREETVREFLAKVLANPTFCDTPYQRIWRNIEKRGLKPLRRSLYYFFENPEDIYEYGAFSDIYGLEDILHECAKIFKSAADNLESSRHVISLISSPGYGKDAIVSKILSLLEGEEFYILKNCPNHDSPLWIIPRRLRQEFSEVFGIKIEHYPDFEREICQSCRTRLIGEYNYDFLAFPVQKLKMSQRAGIGIATSYPKDPYQDTVTEFTGEIQLGKSNLDPQGVEPGFFSLANHGAIYFKEGFRREPEVFHPLLSATQEGKVQAAGRLGEVSVSLCVIFTSNEEVWNDFKTNPNNSPYLSRFQILPVYRNIRLDAEMEIIRKVLRRSDIFEKIHLPVFSLELLARVFIASCFDEFRNKQEKFSHLNKRIDLYNGVDPRSLHFDQTAAQMRREKKDGQGFGLSIRELKEITDPILAQMAIERLAQKEFPGNFCIPPNKLFDQIIRYLEKNMRFDPDYLEHLGKFTRYIYYRVIRPKMLKELVDREKLEKAARNLFERLKSEGGKDEETEKLNEELSELLDLRADELKQFKDKLESYTDNPVVKDFIIEKVISDEFETRTPRADDANWCPICTKDVFSNLKHKD